VLAHLHRARPRGAGAPPRAPVLELAESAPDELEEFDLPFAHEAMARAHALAGDEAAARDWLARARAAAADIADEDDRAIVETDLASILRSPSS